MIDCFANNDYVQLDVFVARNDELAGVEMSLRAAKISFKIER